MRNSSLISTTTVILLCTLYTSPSWGTSDAPTKVTRYPTPQSLQAVIPLDRPLIELPRERGPDYVTSERRLADPDQGIIWVIGLHGVTEQQNVAPWKSSEPRRTAKAILQGPPPDLIPEVVPSSPKKGAKK